MSANDEVKALIDALFAAREKLPRGLRMALARLDAIDEESTAMLQMAIGKLLAMGASRKLIESGVEAVFAVDVVIRKANQS